MDEMNEIIKPSEQEKESCAPRVWRVVKKTLKVFGIVFSVLLVVTIGILAYLWHSLYDYTNRIYRENKFTQEVWVQAEKEYNPEPGKYKGDDYCKRGKMYHDLKENYLKKEMTIEEIEKLLGRTTVRRIYKDDNKSQECIEYYLGWCTRPAGPPTLLVFCPNKHSKWTYFLTNTNDNGRSKFNVEWEY